MTDENSEKKGSNIYVGFSEIVSDRVEKWKNKKNDAWRAYRKQWEENPKNLVVPKFPLHVDVETSSYCNLACPMCTRTILVEKNKWRQNKHFDFDLFKKIIDEGAEKGLCAINLNNFGEPLLNPRLSEMVKYAKEKGIIDVFFHTNAVVLDDELSRKLITSGLDRIIISFDYPDKKRFEEIRVGANYESVLKNILNFIKVRSELNVINPLIRINVIKFPDMDETVLDDLKKLFLDNGADSIGLLDYHNSSENDNAPIAKSYPEGYKSKFVCPQIISRLNIHENGDVVPCCTDINAELKLGNVKDKSLEDMWNSEKLVGIRNAQMNGQFYKIPFCAKCDRAIKEDGKLAQTKDNAD